MASAKSVEGKMLKRESELESPQGLRAEEKALSDQDCGAAEQPRSEVEVVGMERHEIINNAELTELSSAELETRTLLSFICSAGSSEIGTF